MNENSSSENSHKSFPDLCENDFIENVNDVKLIKQIASLSKKLGILLFDRTSCNKWKLKTEENIIYFIENKYKHMHDILYKNIEIFHNTRSYSKVITLVTDCHRKLRMLDEIMDLTKKHYSNKTSKLVIIEYFSTENV